MSSCLPHTGLYQCSREIRILRERGFKNSSKRRPLLAYTVGKLHYTTFHINCALTCSTRVFQENRISQLREKDFINLTKLEYMWVGPSRFLSCIGEQTETLKTIYFYSFFLKDDLFQYFQECWILFVNHNGPCTEP